MNVLCVLTAVVIACSDAFQGNYPGSNQGGFPGGNQGFPGGNQGYPGAYPGGNQGYPGTYPGGNQGYPGSYPGGNQGYIPGGNGGNGPICGNTRCPNNFACSYPTQTCVARQFTCPRVAISNPYAYKTCQMGCDMYQGEKCCQGVCMKGPSLAPRFNNGFSGNTQNSPIRSGAEKPQNSPIQSGAGKEKPVPSGGEATTQAPENKSE